MVFQKGGLGKIVYYYTFTQPRGDGVQRDRHGVRVNRFGAYLVQMQRQQLAKWTGYDGLLSMTEAFL